MCFIFLKAYFLAIKRGEASITNSMSEINVGDYILFLFYLLFIY